MNQYLTFLFNVFLIFMMSCSKNANRLVEMPNDEVGIRKKIKDLEASNDISYGEKEVLLFDLIKKSKKLEYDYGVLASGSVLMTIYADQGDYKKAAELADDIKSFTINKKDSSGVISSIFRKNGLVLGYLGLSDESIKDLKRATIYAEDITKDDKRFYNLSLCYQNQNIYYLNKSFENRKYRDTILLNLFRSNDFAYKMSDAPKTLHFKYDAIAYNYIRLGIFYLEEPEITGNIEKAEAALLRGLEIHENAMYRISPNNKIMMLNQLSWLYTEKKDYKKSIDYAEKALALEKKYKDPYHRVESLEFLSSSYVALNQNQDAEYYLKKYSNLKDSLRFIEKDASNQLSRKILSKAEHQYNMITKQQQTVIIIFSVLLVLSALSIFIWRKRSKNLQKNYNQILKKIKEESFDKNLKKEKAEDLSVLKSTISNEAENMILDKLKDFEKSELFLKKDITISFLADYFVTNTKYLSEAINRHKQQNFNSYINRLRVNYIVKKLYSEPRYRDYKISYLAEECGFSSYQVFNIAFKKVLGISPVFFINELNNDDTIPKEIS